MPVLIFTKFAFAFKLAMTSSNNAFIETMYKKHLIMRRHVTNPYVHWKELKNLLRATKLLNYCENGYYADTPKSSIQFMLQHSTNVYWLIYGLANPSGRSLGETFYTKIFSVLKRFRERLFCGTDLKIPISFPAMFFFFF